MILLAFTALLLLQQTPAPQAPQLVPGPVSSPTLEPGALPQDTTPAARELWAKLVKVLGQELPQGEVALATSAFDLT